jgi:putative beta-barrel porin BBP2
MAVAVLLLAFPATGPCQQSSPPPTTGSSNLSFGGAGWAWLSQFANPAFLGAVYMTPDWPKTGYYPLYPGSFSQPIAEDGISVGPVRLHPMMGIAELYTDNVLRTRTKTNRRSDFATILAPGIRAELPFGGSHSFVADYRTNIQTFHRNPSNNVQDQTASGRFSFNFPGGLQFDLQGEHKLGHDPRGSALDTQSFEVNKWTANSIRGRLVYEGANASLGLNVSSMQWTYFNNNQGFFRDRVSNYAGVTLQGNVSGRTSIVMNVGANQELYDVSKVLSSTTYRASTGLRWNVTDLTVGELLAGYQYLKFNNADSGQTPQIQRNADTLGNFFFMGNMSWTPTPFVTVALQGYRSFQQTVVFNTLFFTSTGANLSAVHTLTDSTALTLNLGLENDDFESPGGTTASPNRVDLIKSAAFGVRYRTLKWVGAGLQYVFEDRASNQGRFNYYANTVMLSLQATF